MLATWSENMKQALAEISTENEIYCQSGCSGTDAWVPWLQHLLDHWQEYYGADATKCKAVLGVESNAQKREFLIEHNCPEVLLTDVSEFNKTSVWNSRRGTMSSCALVA